MTDDKILELKKEGRLEEAFSFIVKSYGERVYWLVRPMCASHEDADDLVQDIFVKIWTALPSFRGEAQLYTWIYRIGMNTALTHLGKEKRRSGDISLEEASSKPGFQPSGDPYFDGDGAERLLRQALLTLPPRQRAVFSMRLYDEMSYEDISKITGKSVGALKASYHFAQEKVRKFLSGKISK